MVLFNVTWGLFDISISSNKTGDILMGYLTQEFWNHFFSRNKHQKNNQLGGQLGGVFFPSSICQTMGVPSSIFPWKQLSPQKRDLSSKVAVGIPSKVQQGAIPAFHHRPSSTNKTWVLRCRLLISWICAETTKPDLLITDLLNQEKGGRFPALLFGSQPFGMLSHQ